ncbi:MAG: peptidyl-prolyl cis-trans isomerase [Verrucomicrobia bacterium]|nr:peptidyl-prolyl cis-trans isomerase [Verrucomicrobiota bacterium]
MTAEVKPNGGASPDASTGSPIDLRLPDEKRAGTMWRPRRPSRLPLIVSLITLAILLVFVVQESIDQFQKRFGTTNERNAPIDKAVGERLAEAGEYGLAAARLSAYASWGNVPPAERARLYYRVADYYMRAGVYDRALDALYRSELIAPLDELQQDIKAAKKRCFDMLGNTAGWQQELRRITDVDSAPPAEGDTVVAEIDGRRITKLELDRLIEARADLMLSQASPWAAPDQLAQQKQQILKQFSTSEAKLRFLQQYVAEQVFAQEAIERGYHTEPSVLETLDQIRTGFLAERVRTAEAEKAAPTPSSLRDHYEAHKVDFVDPERAAVSMIVLDDAEAAAQVVEQLKGGADFAELAKARSTDEATRDNGGEIASFVTRRDGVPGIGRQPDLVGHIFALTEGATSAEPLELDGKCYVFMMKTHIPERTRSFDEVEEAVRQRVFEQRQSELLDALVHRLMLKHNADIHPGAFRVRTPDTEPVDSTTP